MTVVTPELVSRRSQRSVLDGAHAGHVEVLPRSAGVAVPAVVGEVDEDLCTVAGEVADFVAEDGFVTDEGAEPVTARLEHPAFMPALEIDKLMRELLCKERKIPVGDVFAKRNP